MSLTRTKTGAGSVGQSGANTPVPYLHYREEQTSGTHAGTFTSAAWRTRVLNTEVTDTDNLGVLASNQITLVAGTYEILAMVPGVNCDRHKARLRNITDGTTTLVGSTTYTNPSGGFTHSVINGQFTIASTKVFEIQHYCQTTASTYGLGYAGSTGEVEVYTDVELWKLTAATTPDIMPIGYELLAFKVYDSTSSDPLGFDISGFTSTTGSWARVDNGSQNYHGYVNNDRSPAGGSVNDVLTLPNIYLTAGTWSCSIYALTYHERGISTLRFDGVSVGTLDWYSASLTFNVGQSITGIVVPAAKTITPSFIMASKNASSTGYVFDLSAMIFTRTA